MLLTRSSEVLFYIRRCQEDGFTPSLREICRAVGFSSTSTAAYHLRRLEADGLILPRKKYGRRVVIK